MGVIENDAVNADETLAETEPGLAELAVASTLGRVPAGPALRQKNPIRLRPGQELEHPKGLCAAAHGFSLHAATSARADEAGDVFPADSPWHLNGIDFDPGPGANGTIYAVENHPDALYAIPIMSNGQRWDPGADRDAASGVHA